MPFAMASRAERILTSWPSSEIFAEIDASTPKIACSEAAQAIFGVDASISAKISLDGQLVNIRSARDAIANGIYLVPEDRRIAGLIVDIPIRENITLPALERYATRGLVSKSRESKKAAEMCEKLNVKAP